MSTAFVQLMTEWRAYYCAMTALGSADVGTTMRAEESLRPPLWRLAIGLGFAGFLVAAAGSWIPSLWGDEAASVMSAQRPLSSLFVMLTHVDAVHGTYYLFLHFWVALFGASPFVVRLPPAIAVGFAVAGIVYIVDRLGTRRLAICAGIVCCVIPRVTYMGEETRIYAFTAAYAAWATWVLIRLVMDRGASRMWWVAYGALMAFGTYTFLPFAAFLLVHALTIVSAKVPRAFVERWLGTTAIVIAVSTPLIFVGFLQRGQIGYLAAQENITFDSMTVGLWFWTPTFAVVGWSLILVGLGAAVWRLRRGGRKPGLSLALVAFLWMVGPGLIFAIASIARNDFTSRYLSYSAPAAAILMALGIQTLARGGLKRMIGLAVVVILFAVPIYLSQRTPYAKNGSDWAELSATIGSLASAGDAIVFDDGATPSRRPRLALHTYPVGFAGLNDVTLKTPYQQSSLWYDRTFTVPVAAQLGRFANIRRVWLVEYVDSGKPDTYGIASLKGLGYHVQATYSTRSTRIIELVAG